MGVYHFASRTKTRDKIATMFNILIIYSSKKDTLVMRGLNLMHALNYKKQSKNIVA